MPGKLLIYVSGLIVAAIFLIVIFVLFFTPFGLITSLAGIPGNFDEGRKVIGTIIAVAGLGMLYVFFKSLLPKDEF